MFAQVRVIQTIFASLDDERTLPLLDVHITSSSGDLLERMPLLVLVGAGTANSAEIVTGALQDRGRALGVGEPTLGKGSVQNVIELPGGAGLLLTTLRYLTPKGRAIQACSLMPDVAVKSADASSAVCEADIAGHLHTEGCPYRKPIHAHFMRQISRTDGLGRNGGLCPGFWTDAAGGQDRARRRMGSRSQQE